MTPLIAFFATLFFVGILGVFSGFFLKSFLIIRSKETAEKQVKKIKSDAEKKASEILIKAQEEVKTEKRELIALRKTILAKEVYVDTKEKEIDQVKKDTQKKEEDLKNLIQKQTKKLEDISHISKKEAGEMLVKAIEEEERESLLARIRKLEQEGQEQITQRAKDMLVTAIHRYGNSVENDIMSTSVHLPDDDTKGKIIGKEGRNIKSFEKVSGVQLIIDDTPGIITISSFDPIRRAIAKQALDILIEDGRIQPARIEQVIKETKESVINMITEKGKAAALECEIHDLPQELVRTLGTLFFRYSYGQNVLQHSLEMAHIAGVLAEQVGADVYVAKAGALLHDIGKATDHTDTGSHVDIGRRMLRKHGISEEIIKAMQSHHEEYPYENVEAILVQVADAISGGRPGARSDIANMYIKKLDGLERISKNIPGVENAYALAAGREVRVFVNPERVDDYEAKKIAREVAKQIEQELKYPGEIKVHVIRESRIIEYAR